MNALTFLAAEMNNNMDDVTHALYDREYFGYISVVLSYINAIALTAILIIVPFVMIMDVIYLILPNAKALYDNYVATHNDRTGRIVQKLLVSKNAIEAFEDAATTNTSPLWCYMKRSIKFYVIVVVAIILLTTGLDTILRFTYKLIGNIIEWFTELA